MNKLKLTSLFLQLSLAASYLSAVADRFGLWGKAGDPGVVWGNFASFTEYTQILNPFLPSSFIAPLAWFVTALEVVIALFLVVSFRIKETAYASAFLLGLFALAMVVSIGVKAPLDYSVFTASAGSLLLAQMRKTSL